MTYLHLDSNTADLNRHEEAEARKDFAHDVKLAEQRLQGIDPVQRYRADILANRDMLQDLLAGLLDSGRLTDMAHLAMAEREDPDKGEAIQQFTDILEQLATNAAKKIAEDRGGLYDATWVDCDMDYQESLINLLNYKVEISR